MICNLQVLFVVFLGSGLISWTAKKHVVARSSTEVEYWSLVIVTIELYWLRKLFKDLHIPLASPPIIWYVL
jgi:hypothetical protein